MAAFKLQNSFSYELTLQEIVIKMIDYEDETSSNLSYRDVLSQRVEEIQREYERAVDQGGNLEEIQSALDNAKRTRNDAIRFDRELHTAAEEIVQGLGHPTLVLVKSFYDEGIISFTIRSAYYWAKSHGKEVPEWAPTSITEEGTGRPVSTHTPTEDDEHLPRGNNLAVWEGATFDFLAHRKLRMSLAAGKSKTADLEQIGLLDKHTKELNTAGAALLGLAATNSISQKGRGSDRGISKKVMSELRSSLRQLAQNDSDPFFEYNPADGWKPRFRVNDRRNAGDERAKAKAKSISYQDGVHGASGPDEYTFESEDPEDAASKFLDEHAR